MSPRDILVRHKTLRDIHPSLYGGLHEDETSRNGAAKRSRKWFRFRNSISGHHGSTGDDAFSQHPSSWSKSIATLAIAVSAAVCRESDLLGDGLRLSLGPIYPL
jgi:hypothetical protein